MKTKQMTSHHKKNPAAVALGRKRWANKTKAERIAYGAMLLQSRRNAKQQRDKEKRNA